jgi:sarcosine oxidase, subunit gamma
VVEMPLPTSPLAVAPAAAVRMPEIDLAERPFLCKIRLRGDAADGDFVAAAAQALGVALPTRSGAGTGHGGVTILCLAPDEWLVVNGAGARDLIVCLREVLTGQHAVAIDASCAIATIGVTGGRAALLLRKICSIDLARQASAGRCCWRTRIGPFAVLLHWRGEDEGFDLHVARSYARSFWLWLNDAAEALRE